MFSSLGLPVLDLVLRTFTCSTDSACSFETSVFSVPIFSSSTGGARGRARLAPTKTFALACDINLGREIDVPATVVQSPFGPLFPSLCVLHVEPRNVFASRGKSSALRAETHHTRNFSVVLETLQLYSKFSILHLEFKCVHPIRGESSGVPIV